MQGYVTYLLARGKVGIRAMVGVRVTVKALGLGLGLTRSLNQVVGHWAPRPLALDPLP